MTRYFKKDKIFALCDDDNCLIYLLQAGFEEVSEALYYICCSEEDNFEYEVWAGENPDLNHFVFVTTDRPLAIRLSEKVLDLYQYSEVRQLPTVWNDSQHQVDDSVECGEIIYSTQYGAFEQ